MSVILGCIADDFTGATDLTGTLVRAGMRGVPSGPAEAVEDTVYATEELEETAKLYLLLHGRNPRCLTEAQIAELRETFSLP